jgi:hypothetical protein
VIPDRLSFWFGTDSVDRRVTFASEYKARSGMLEKNAAETMVTYEAICIEYAAATGKNGPRRYASGWRPALINDRTKNSAEHSAHIDAHAGDGEDSIDGEFTWWLYDHIDVLQRHRAYMEHPVATVVRSWANARSETLRLGKQILPMPWCHLSPVPPKSLLNIYYPNIPSVDEWVAFKKMGGTPGMKYDQWLNLMERVA